MKMKQSLSVEVTILIAMITGLSITVWGGGWLWAMGWQQQNLLFFLSGFVVGIIGLAILGCALDADHWYEHESSA